MADLNACERRPVLLPSLATRGYSIPAETRLTLSRSTLTYRGCAVA